MQKRNKAVKAFDPLFKEELQANLAKEQRSLIDFVEFDKQKGGMKPEY